MSKNLIIQFFLGSIIVIIISGTFFYYKKDNKVEIINAEYTEEITVGKNSSNLINNIKYSSTDLKGNKYEINSLTGEIDITNPDVIMMTDVTAKITLITSEIINISSKYAKYNSDNFESNFTKNVVVTHLNNKINCDNMDLSLEISKLIFYNNVIYRSDLMNLKADKAEIDLKTKNSKIFMNNKLKKVLAIGY